MSDVPAIMIVVGGPGSGKDILVQAIGDMGAQYARFISKHTSRKRNPDDGPEMICPSDNSWDLENCDLIYENFKDRFGVKYSDIWQGLADGGWQVVVISDLVAINELLEAFGSIVRLVYVHSETTPEEFAESYSGLEHDDYVTKRKDGYENAFDLYCANVLQFDHVLIYGGVDEDLYDQIFRLFRAYKLKFL